MQNLTSTTQASAAAALIAALGGTPPPPPPPTNLALNKPATGSTPCASAEGPAKAVNGTVTGGNADKFCSPTTPSWLQVDLGSAQPVTNFVVKHAATGGEPASFNTRAFTIQLSTDGSTWSTAVSVTNNSIGMSSHTIPPASARYVRLGVTAATQTADTATRIYEFEVYGGADCDEPRPQPTSHRHRRLRAGRGAGEGGQRQRQRREHGQVLLRRRRRLAACRPRVVTDHQPVRDRARRRRR